MLGVEYNDIEQVTRIMDSGLFTIPILNAKVGVDALIGLLPVAGDTVSLVVSLGIVLFLVTPETKLKDIVWMLMNVVIDYFVGSIPLVGDLFDLYFKANQANLEIARKYHV